MWSSGYQDILGPGSIEQKYLIVLLHLVEAEYSYLPPAAGQKCSSVLDNNTTGVIKWSTMKIQSWVLFFQRLKTSDVRHHVSPGKHTRQRCSGGLRYYNRGLRIHLRGSRPFRYTASARWCYTRMTATYVWHVGSPLAHCNSTGSLISKTKSNTGVKAVQPTECLTLMPDSCWPRVHWALTASGAQGKI